MIARRLLSAGLLQLGWFVTDDQPYPYRLRLEMLPAYPALMQQVVYRAVQTLPQTPFDRLVATADSVPLGAAISLQTGVPLVYSRGRDEAPVHDLVGAYDVGHPACLVSNTLSPDLATFLQKADHVGLTIHTIVPLIAERELAIEGVTIQPVFTMTALIHELRQHDAIPPAQALAVLNTLN